MNMTLKGLLAAALMLAMLSAVSFAAAQDQPQSSKPPAASQTKQAAGAHPSHDSQDEGQKIFDQNCSRCHTAPDGFSPSISGTIVRHMRIRASLSAQDEKELLRFLNP